MEKALVSAFFGYCDTSRRFIDSSNTDEFLQPVFRLRGQEGQSKVPSSGSPVCNGGQFAQKCARCDGSAAVTAHGAMEHTDPHLTWDRSHSATLTLLILISHELGYLLFLITTRQSSTVPQ